MSVYCYRIVEFKQDDGTWVQCGDTCDNYHGFNDWHNKQFANRGFPKDCTITVDSLKDPEDGREWTWGYSYITLSELAEWVAKEYKDAIAFFYRELQSSKESNVEKRLARIEEKLGIPQEEKKNDVEEEYQCDYLGDYNQFEELFDECFEFYDGLNTQMIMASSLAEQKNEDRWVSEDRVRIIFYFG